MFTADKCRCAPIGLQIWNIHEKNIHESFFSPQSLILNAERRDNLSLLGVHTFFDLDTIPFLFQQKITKLSVNIKLFKKDIADEFGEFGKKAQERKYIWRTTFCICSCILKNSILCCWKYILQIWKYICRTTFCRFAAQALDWTAPGNVQR